MGRIFLSYVREEASRARAIATALEKAGHSVWWDRHIKGGARYSKEIDKALKQADVVIVLWSERSVESDWVRDEAAFGRDRDRLVPITLDSSEPPLGFRQHQAIDLSRWTGRGKPPQLRIMLEAIESLGSKGHRLEKPKSVRSSDIKSDRQPIWRRSWWLIAGLVVVALGLLVSRPWQSNASVPVLAIVPSDNSAASQSLAGSLLVQLGSLQAANADLLHLVEPESGAKPDMIFKVAVIRGSTNPGASLALVDNRAGTLLWSREFVQPGGIEADLRQQIAYSAGQVLRCASEALAPTHRQLQLPTLKLYLNGCADLSNLLSQDPRAIIPLFRKVTEQAPTFAGGWGKLLLAEMFAFRQTNLSDTFLRKQLRAHVDQVRKLHPTLAEPPLAESWLQPPRPISGWMRLAAEAIAKDSDHPEVLMNHATGLLHLGRIREAVADARRAVQLEPLYPAARNSLVFALMDGGAIEAAENMLREAERLWPGASNNLAARFNLNYHYLDAREAKRIAQSGRLASTPTPAQLSFIEARIQPSAANIERAIADARKSSRTAGGLWHYAQVLAHFGRKEEVTELLLSVDPRLAPGLPWVLFRPYYREVRRDPRFMQIMKLYEVTPYWQETGKWPDFCFEPDLPYDCKAEAAKLS